MPLVNAQLVAIVCLLLVKLYTVNACDDNAACLKTCPNGYCDNVMDDAGCYQCVLCDTTTFTDHMTLEDCITKDGSKCKNAPDRCVEYLNFGRCIKCYTCDAGQKQYDTVDQCNAKGNCAADNKKVCGIAPAMPACYTCVDLAQGPPAQVDYTGPSTPTTPTSPPITGSTTSGPTASGPTPSGPPKTTTKGASQAIASVVVVVLLAFLAIGNNKEE